MKILFTTPTLEHPPAGGPFLRIENSIKALSQIADLHIISRVCKKEMGGERAESFYRKYCSSFLYAPSVDASYSRNFAEKIWYKIRELRYFYSHKKKLRFLQAYEAYLDAQFITHYAQKHNISIIWFGYGCKGTAYWVIKEVKKLNPAIKIICDTDSVQSRYSARGLSIITDPQIYQQTKRESEEKAQEEAEWVNTCHVTTAVSEVDADYYRSLATNPERIKRFSNVIDIESYKKKPTPPLFIKKPSIYLAGYFGPHSPMDYAARWIINNVLPIIQKEIPDIHLFIVGKDSDTTLADIKNSCITITGQVESVLPYLTNADVALVPLMFESGTRFKILEAGACGIPIVSTTLGAEGLEVEHEKHIMIADTPTAFAQAVIRLIKDKDFAQYVATNCKNLVNQNYSIETLKKEALSIFKYLDY